MLLHDTHFHLDLFENPTSIIQRIEQAQVYTIAVTNLPDLFDHTYQLTKTSKYIRAALGFHPELVAAHKSQLGTFKNKLGLTRYIGEVGLDNFNKTPSEYQDQKKVFEKILELTHDEGNKILTIHSRRSESDVISMIGPKFSGKAILHWYSGSIKDLERALSYGFYFSINAAMVQSDNGKKIIDRLPLSNILLETDGPFITHKQQKCFPPHVEFTASEILLRKSKKGYEQLNKEFLNENFKCLLK